MLNVGDRFNNKIVEVTGTVSRLESGAFGIATVELKTNFPKEPVVCKWGMAETSPTEKLKPGDQVIIRGKCKGYLGGIVTLEKCTLVRVEQTAAEENPPDETKKPDAAQAAADQVKALQAVGVDASSDSDRLLVVISNDNLTEEGLIQPKVFRQLKKAQPFYSMDFGVGEPISGSLISDAGLAQVKELGDCQFIDLRGASRITDAGLANLSGKKKLYKLTLTQTKITAAGLAHLEGLSELTELLLQLCPNLGDPGFVHLENLPKLRELYVQGTPITDTSLQSIGKIKSLVELRVGVYLDPQTPTGVAITDKGLGSLQGLTKLTSLDLTGCCRPVTDAGMRAFQEMPDLEELFLGPCPKVTDAGLAVLRGKSNLHMLGLAGAKITDAGLVHLKGLTLIHYLDLSNTAVTDKGLVYLESLKGLHHLYLDGTKVSKAGLAKLRKALPNFTE